MDIVVDIAVILVYFVAVVYVGLRFGKRDDTMEGFALGGRSIPWLAVLASIIAAETSAATFLGAPGEGFKLVNYTYLQVLLGAILGRTIVAYLFIKTFFDLKVYSIYEYLEVRFGGGTRTAASAVFIITRLLASGARLYVAAIILAVAYRIFTGSQPTALEQMLIYFVAIVVITILTAIYTSFGGIRAVVWTDCIQSSVMLGGALCTIVLLLATMPGGWATISDFFSRTPTPLFLPGTTSSASFLENLRSVLSSEYTIWVALFGSTFTAMATHGTDQDMVQRMLTAPDYKKSRMSLIASGIVDVPIAFIFLTIGILMNCLYQHSPDPTLPEKNSEIFAHFILTRIPVGLRGLLIAGIFATAMGSLSAALNALATSFTRDFFARRHPSAPEEKTVAAAKRFTFVFAGLMILVASATAYFVINRPESRIIPIVLGIFGYTYGSLLGIFLLGLLTKRRGSDLGNLVGMLAGFLSVALLTGMPNELLHLVGMKPITALSAIPVVSFPWRIMFGALTTMTIAAMFSQHQRLTQP